MNFYEFLKLRSHQIWDYLQTVRQTDINTCKDRLESYITSRSDINGSLHMIFMNKYIFLYIFDNAIGDCTFHVVWIQLSTSLAKVKLYIQLQNLQWVLNFKIL